MSGSAARTLVAVAIVAMALVLLFKVDKGSMFKPLPFTPRCFIACLMTLGAVTIQLT